MEFENKLSGIDWKQVELTPAVKNFYQENPEVKNMSETDVANWRKEHGISIKGGGCPNPILSFAQSSFPEGIYFLSNFLFSPGFNALFTAIIKRLHSAYTTPTPIQAQGWSVALSGRDILRLFLFTTLFSVIDFKIWLGLLKQAQEKHWDLSFLL